MAVVKFFTFCLVGVALLVVDVSEGVRQAYDAGPGKFPWLVSVLASDDQEHEFHLCGGTLIAPQWVVTAAHCLDHERINTLAVRVGAYNIKEKDGEWIDVVDFKKHPGYQYGSKPYKDDIALLYLERPALSAVPALIPRGRFSESDLANCLEVGWGATGEGKAGSSVPKYTVIPQLNHGYCEVAYGSLPSNSICAGRTGSGSCVGDNGGPVTCVTSHGDVLGAIMSWRSGCAEAGRPAVYLDVSHYIGWLRSVTGLNV